MNIEKIKILFCGEGGQGIQIMAKIFANALIKQGYKISLMPHYGVEMRMGVSMAFLQVSEKKIVYPKFDKSDILVCTTQRDINMTKEFANWKTNIINGMNLSSFLKENKIVNKSLNMLCLGILSKEFKDYLPLDTGYIKDEIKNQLKNKPNLEKNLDAYMSGINIDPKLYKKSLNSFPKIDLSPTKTTNKKKEYYHWPSHCKGCGLCIEKCPVGALSWDKEKVNYFGAPIPIVDMDKCIACGICERICPDAAIKIKKK